MSPERGTFTLLADQASTVLRKNSQVAELFGAGIKTGA
jgi:hypothetical protein